MMADEFGEVRATTIAKDHVFAELGGNTIDQALARGVEPKRIWTVVCEAFDVPPARR